MRSEHLLEQLFLGALYRESGEQSQGDATLHFESRQPPTRNERHLALRNRELLMHTNDLPG